MQLHILQNHDRNTKFKGLESTNFIFKENKHEYIENDCIVTKVLIMALSPCGGIMSNYFVIVMGKYSQNN